jgi:hypothetical protein
MLFNIKIKKYVVHLQRKNHEENKVEVEEEGRKSR